MRLKMKRVMKIPVPSYFPASLATPLVTKASYHGNNRLNAGYNFILIDLGVNFHSSNKVNAISANFFMVTRLQELFSGLR